MNKSKYLLLAAVVVLAACSKEGPQLMKGSYSFKTGGSIELDGSWTGSDPVRDTVISRRVVTESGQMHIVQRDGPRMVLTMNITGGDPVVMQATAEGSTITIESTERFVPVHGADGLSFAYHEFSIYGTGTRYDNTIVFDLIYEGPYSEASFDGEIMGSRISCIATENE